MDPQPPEGERHRLFVWFRGQLPKENCAREGLYCESPTGLKFLMSAPHKPGDIIDVREEWAVRGYCDDGAASYSQHPQGLRLFIEYLSDGRRGRVHYPDDKDYARIRALVTCYEDEVRERSANTLPDWAVRTRERVVSVDVEQHDGAMCWKMEVETLTQ